MNPAARYIRESDVYIAASVPTTAAPSCDESGAIVSTIWGITAHTNVFALHVSLRVVDGVQGDVRFTPDIADGVSISIEYSDGTSTLGGLGRRSVGDGVAVAKMESSVTDRRIDAHMAVSPLPSPGEVRIVLAMGDGSKLGEWVLAGEGILESSRTVTGHETA